MVVVLFAIERVHKDLEDISLTNGEIPRRAAVPAARGINQQVSQVSKSFSRQTDIVPYRGTVCNQKGSPSVH